MKKILKNNVLSLVMVVSLLSLGAVFAGDIVFTEGEGLDVDDNLIVDGNLGIGTASPNGMFEVRQGLSSTSRISTNDSDYLEFITASDGNIITSVGIKPLVIGNSEANQRMYFFTGGEFNETNVHMTIAPTGEIGIGTPFPEIWGGELVLAKSSNPRFTLSQDSIQAFMSFEFKDGAAYLTKDNGDSFIIGKKDDATASTIIPQVTVDWQGKVGIGTISPSYPLEVRSYNGDVTAWFERNISATGFITRTHVFDKSQGSALDLIKDASDLKVGDEIDHSQFYGHVSYDVEECTLDENDKETCEVKTEEGVMLDMEVELLRQAVFELKTELCVHSDKYSWC